MLNSAQLHSEILADMEDWPNPPRIAHSILFAATTTEQSHQAIVLNELQDDPAWEVVHLSKRYVPYFGRSIWFYCVVADSQLAAYQGFSKRPSDSELLDFMALRKVTLSRIS